MSTYYQETRAKFPNRPYAARSTWELKNIVRALSSFPMLNTYKEERRLTDCKLELEERHE